MNAVYANMSAIAKPWPNTVPGANETAGSASIPFAPNTARSKYSNTAVSAIINAPRMRDDSSIDR